MALFPQQFIDDLKHQADIVVVIQDYVSLKKSGADVQGPLPVPRREDAVVSRQPGQGLLPLLRLRRRRRRLQVPRAAREGRLPRRGEAARAALRHDDSGSWNRPTSSGPSAAEREALLKVHEVGGRVVPRAAGLAAGARASGGRSRTAASPTRPVEALGLGFAPPSRDGLKDALLKQGFSQATAACGPVCSSSAMTAPSSIGSGIG